MDAIQPDFERLWLRSNDVLIARILFTVWAFYSIAVVLALLRSDARTIISITAVALMLTLIELWMFAGRVRDRRHESRDQDPNHDRPRFDMPVRGSNEAATTPPIL